MDMGATFTPLILIAALVAASLIIPKICDAVWRAKRPPLHPTPLGLKELQKRMRSLGYSIHLVKGSDCEILERKIDGSRRCLNSIEDIHLSSSGERQSIIFVAEYFLARVDQYERRKGTIINFGECLMIINDEDLSQKFRKFCESHKEEVWNLARYGKEKPSFMDQVIFRSFPELYVRKFI
jgi:hypothetical protein